MHFGRETARKYRTESVSYRSGYYARFCNIMGLGRCVQLMVDIPIVVDKSAVKSNHARGLLSC